MVRDEAAREKLQAQIGDIGLIMLVVSASHADRIQLTTTAAGHRMKARA